MKLVGTHNSRLAPATQTLLRRTVGSFTGLTNEIAFVMRSELEPAVSMAVAEIGDDIWSGTHHIAGIGTTADEAVTRCLAESLERYAHYIWPRSNPQKIITVSYRTMHAHSRVLVPGNLEYFSEDQLSRPGFPFTRLDTDQSIGWLEVRSLTSGVVCWMPAQIALVGYSRPSGEPRFMLGVTSGSAAHTTFPEALANALLELIQMDSAMGHWYGSRPAIRIEHDGRTAAVSELVQRYLHQNGPAARFYWLANADLAGLTAACVLNDKDVPRSAVGLGTDLRLSRALQKSFLEAVAVAKLAKANLIRASGESHAAIDPNRIYDFDSNVAHYATTDSSTLEEKFGTGPSALASDLPADVDIDITGAIQHLIAGFRDTGKELVFLDLTTADIDSLGFRVARVWSPDTISLCLPSAPARLHPRFKAYGGTTNEVPHPYP